MTEYETRSFDLAGDEICEPRPTLAAAIRRAQLIKGELGVAAHVWQREDRGEWARVWPKRRWRQALAFLRT